jgi:hypothetical protein
VGRKRRWGYFVWVVAGIVIGVPEITAAVAGDVLPFITISETVGHLERRWPAVELAVVAAIVFLVFSTTRTPPKSQSAGPGEPVRTPGGRLTVQAPAPKPPPEFDEEDAPRWFAVAAVGACALVAGLTALTATLWDDPHHYRPSYVLYGSLGLLWLVVPSIYAFAAGKDPPFPTVFRTVTNLEEWLRSRPWRWNLGPFAGWLVAYLVLAGLVILLLHLALYPYPDITHILNPKG